MISGLIAAAAPTIKNTVKWAAKAKEFSNNLRVFWGKKNLSNDKSRVKYSVNFS